MAQQTDKDRVVSPKAKNSSEERVEASLRPRDFGEVIGREKEKKSLGILLEAAKRRGEAVDHILFHGPPGLGKTSFAHVIANEMGKSIRVTSGPAIERQGDLASILTNLDEGDILFIDEIHRLNRVVEEVLYPAMEDFALDIVLGKGPSARTLRLDLSHFTLIGATTRIGLLSGPLRDRFGCNYRLDFMSLGEMEALVHQKARMLKASVEDAAAREIAQRARRTPRVAVRLLKRVRDLADVEEKKVIDKNLALRGLEMLEIDAVGLDDLDRKILTLMVENYSGGPVGLQTLASALSEELDTISDVVEPYLIQEGFIERTPRGRKVTKKAYLHLGIKPDNSKDEQRSLV